MTPPAGSLTVNVNGFPNWMPEELRASVRAAYRARCEKDKVTFKRSFSLSASFSSGERKVLHYSKPIPVSLWAEKYRRLKESSLGNRWHNVFTPYLVGIMDAANLPGVQTVIICKSPQTGGSEAGHNLVGYCVDRLPGPCMYVFPDEKTAKKVSQDRIIPMFRNSKRLAQYMTGIGDDASSLRIKLVHMVIYLAWSGSVSSLGTTPIRVLILDELDKYEDPKNEARSEDLAEKRCNSWKSRKKIFKLSTPTTENGPIWTAYTKEANARFLYHVECPHCGGSQLMKLERIGWPGKDTDAEPSSADVHSDNLAWYSCEHCGVCWNDNDRDRAVRKGKWREEKSGMDMYDYISAYRPLKVGFHIPAWLSYFISLSEIASVILKYKESGLMADLKHLRNQYEALPWAEEHEEREEEDIEKLCDDRPRGAVPGPLPETPEVPRVSCLLAGVDTQKGYFRYVIRAYGFGESEESWLIQAGSLASFSELEQVLFKNVYKDASGKEYHVHGVMIDAMGNRTRAVYQWASKHKGVVFPWKGMRHMESPYSMVPIEYYPGKSAQKVKIPGGLTLFKVDTTFFKSGLAHKLSVVPGDPGAFHLHSNENGELNQYFKEMCAEVWDDAEQAWMNPLERPNHYWDCETMVSALAYIKGVRNIPLPKSRQQMEEPQEKTTSKKRHFRRYVQ